MRNSCGRSTYYFFKLLGNGLLSVEAFQLEARQFGDHELLLGLCLLALFGCELFQGCVLHAEHDAGFFGDHANHLVVPKAKLGRVPHHFVEV